MSKRFQVTFMQSSNPSGLSTNKLLIKLIVICFGINAGIYLNYDVQQNVKVDTRNIWSLVYFEAIQFVVTSMQSKKKMSKNSKQAFFFLKETRPFTRKMIDKLMLNLTTFYCGQFNSVGIDATQ